MPDQYPTRSLLQSGEMDWAELDAGIKHDYKDPPRIRPGHLTKMPSLAAQTNRAGKSGPQRSRGGMLATRNLGWRDSHRQVTLGCCPFSGLG